MKFLALIPVLMLGIMFKNSGFDNEGHKHQMVLVEAGFFESKNKDDETGAVTTRQVFVDSFLISKVEITHAQFITFLQEIDCNPDGTYHDLEFGIVDYVLVEDRDCAIKYEDKKFVFKPNDFITSADCPVVMVTWFGANAYCQWAGGRLPSEKEWEFAAKGGIKSQGYNYSGSNNIDEVAWCIVNSGGKAHPVGLKAPNELGIYDMSGNVWEWCSDWYYKEKQIEPRKRPKDFKDTDNVLRGGSWFVHETFCTNTFRLSYSPRYASLNYGFRIAKDL